MNELSNVCPVCGEGGLQPQVGKNPVEYKGVNKEINLHYSVCDACGSEQSAAVQLRQNKRAMVAFKKQVDGLLSGAEVRVLRQQLGLSQAEAAQVFGGGPVAFSKYESDDVAQSEAMDKLLCLADEVPVAFELLLRRAGIEHTGTGADWQEVAGWSFVPDPAPTNQRTQLRIVSSSAPMADETPRWSDAA